MMKLAVLSPPPMRGRCPAGAEGGWFDAQAQLLLIVITPLRRYRATSPARGEENRAIGVTR